MEAMKKRGNKLISKDGKIIKHKAVVERFKGKHITHH